MLIVLGMYNFGYHKKLLVAKKLMEKPGASEPMGPKRLPKSDEITL